MAHYVPEVRGESEISEDAVSSKNKEVYRTISIFEGGIQ